MDKIKKGGTIEILFYLKCRAGWVEDQHRKKELSEDNIPKINIYLPENNRDLPKVEAE